MKAIDGKLVVVAALVVMAVALCVPAIAQEAEELPPGMTASDMEAWMKASAPGPEHEMLAAMAGSWTFEGTFWMAPDAPPSTSTGTAEREMIYGGRILVEKVTTEWQGESFEGMGMTGFDNVSGNYWGTWIDSMSTGIMVSSGVCSGGSCEFTGTYNDPMTGGPKTTRMTMTVEGDREVHRAYESGPSGEFVSMEIVYTRVK